jgi:hypothetical protein
VPETYSLPRDGDLPLRFDGERIASASSRRRDGPGQNRWHELALYRTGGGRFVLAATYRSCWQGEDDRHWVTHADAIGAVRDAIRSYPAVPPGVGYPPGESYAEKQARLEGDLRRRYDQVVSELFREAGDDFAEEID